MLLGARLDLLDCTDVERLCVRILERHRASLASHAEYEDALAYLLSTSWRLSLKYDAARDRRPNFAGYLTFILPLRLVDWRRATSGRLLLSGATYERERPVVLSLDSPLGDDDRALLDLLPGGEDPAEIVVAD